jgi:hypothetical protein
MQVNHRIANSQHCRRVVVVLVGALTGSTVVVGVLVRAPIMELVCALSVLTVASARDTDARAPRAAMRMRIIGPAPGH